MRRPLTLAAIACLLALPSTAAAQSWSNFSAAGALELDVRASQREDPAAADGLEETVLAGLGLRAFAGKRFGLALGIDARFGAGAQGGFAYDAALLPIGGGVRLGSALFLGVTTGIAVSGVTGHLPFTLETPLEARLHLSLGRHLHLAGWGRVGWVTADSREGGSTNAPFGDELRAGATVRFGRGGARWAERWGNGIYVGALYGERLGTRELGLVIGYGITDGYFPDKRPTPRGL